MRLSATRIASGTATALVLALTVAVPSAGSATAPGSTAVDVAHAKDALRAVIKSTNVKLATIGGASAEHYLSLDDGKAWQWGRSTMTVDAQRHLVAESDYEGGELINDAVYYVDPCSPGSGGYNAPTTRTFRYVSKQGVGTWSSVLRPTSEVRGGLALLHRPGVRWVSERHRSESVAREVSQDGPTSDLTSDVFEHNTFSDYDYLDGMRTDTASGTTYVMHLRETSYPGQPTTGPEAPALVTVTMDVDASGAMTGYVDRYNTADPKNEFIERYAVAYGARTVVLPTKRSVISGKTLVPGCRAVLTREEVTDAATYSAMYANDTAAHKHKPVTVKALRSLVGQSRQNDPYHLDITVRKIKGGVEIVGRHHLLPHPVVWTVFVRHGKAVTHHVR